MSAGSMEEVVFMDHVNRKDLGLEPAGPLTSEPPAVMDDETLTSWPDSRPLIPPVMDDRCSPVTDLRKNLL